MARTATAFTERRYGTAVRTRFYGNGYGKDTDERKRKAENKAWSSWSTQTPTIHHDGAVYDLPALGLQTMHFQSFAPKGFLACWTGSMELSTKRRQRLSSWDANLKHASLHRLLTLRFYQIPFFVFIHVCTAPLFYSCMFVISTLKIQRR